MTGYCSNSPMRCEYARSMLIITQANHCCPKCGFSLVPANNLSNNFYKEQQYLILVLAIIALLLLVLSYIYYTNFV